MLNNFVDSTGQYARITTFMKDVGTDKMNDIQERLQQVVKRISRRTLQCVFYRKGLGVFKRN